MGTIAPNKAISSLPADYAERVYAGVLGKIIGVYLGRPFEGASHDWILKELGEVDYYVHEQRGQQLIVTDDDISGTFTFLRALQDYGNSADLTAEQIGQSWLNYIIENRTILWWGGMGMSTEHTAFLRLKHGMKAPESGSIATNGQVVAEQIGSQIFIDGWGMINPGDPERAAHFARLAASVSHDGEAIYGAQVVAALVAQAFVEQDIDRLIDTAVSLIPADSLINRLIGDIREWHAQGQDWMKGFRSIEADYGYDKYGGNCHMIPNHALIIHALVQGGGDFQRSLMIANTCGWDTDCNSGNVGCILGVRNGLAGIDDGPDWRGPVADRLFLPTADGGRCVSDAARETYEIVNVGRALRGLEPVAPKNGARFHFDLPGSVQGFTCSDDPACRSVATIQNVEGNSNSGSRSLAIQYSHLATGRTARVGTKTFPSPADRKMGGYGLIASPTLYPGQRVSARVVADQANLQPVTVSLYLGVYDEEDKVQARSAEASVLDPGDSIVLEYTVPDTGGFPIAEVGIEAVSETRANGTLYLDYLTWEGEPDVVFRKTPKGDAWRHAWVNGVSDHMPWGEPFRVVQNEGTGLLIQGTREWRDYRVTAAVMPHLVVDGGIAARVQGMKRYYALLLTRDGRVQLVRELDGRTVLADRPFAWSLGESHELALEAQDSTLRGYINGELVVEASDSSLESGAVAFVLTEGRMASQELRVQPLPG